MVDDCRRRVDGHRNGTSPSPQPHLLHRSLTSSSPHLSQSANVACGGHAGDASIMAANLALASTRHVSVGSHPGYDDKPGFGRRVIPMTAAEIEELVAFQTGALLGVAGLARTRQPAGEPPVQVTHVKPHGALNNVACVDKSVAAAIARAVLGVDPSLIMLAPASSELLYAAEAAGLQTASEVFADRAYMADGNLAPRSMEGSVIHDPGDFPLISLTFSPRFSHSPVVFLTLFCHVSHICLISALSRGD